MGRSAWRRQGEACCASRGYQLVETYVEPGASATNDRRPEFQRMIEAGTSRPAPFHVVIVHSFSRFFRDAFDMEFYVRKLAKNGVKLLATVLDRRQERSERQREHIAELNKRAAESEARLKRLYDAIEAGVADLDDPALKDRIDSLKAIRDQAQADAERAETMLQHSGSQAVTPQMLSKFACTARQRIRLEGGGYRRDHLRALAQRVELAEGEVRIMGSKSRLLQTLVANGGANAAPTQGLKWRRGWDSNPRYPCEYAAFRVRCFRPLSHLSSPGVERGRGT